MIAGGAKVWRGSLNGTSPKRGAVMQRFAAIAIPLLAIWITVAMVWYQHEVDERKGKLVQSEQERIGVLASRMGHEIDAMALRLLMFSSNIELRQLLLDGGGVNSRPAFEQEFLAYMRLGGLLDQGRVLDAHGMELLRINGHQKNQPYLVPVAQLQAKGRRPYFLRAAALPAGGVDISPINQNVEQGKIEQPLRLTLRVSTPIRAEDDSLLGVLVFNYRVDQLLGLMAEYDLLLGAGPFWLRAPRSSTATGVVAGEERRNISTQLADALDHLSQQKRGWLSVNNGDGLLVFTALGTQTKAGYLHSPDSPAKVHGWHDWRVLSLMPEKMLPGSTLAFFLPLLFSFSLLLALASWLWARVGLQRELAVRQSGQLAFENRRLARRLFAVQEEERRLLAQELHDEMGQSLAAIKTNAVFILRHCSKENVEKVAESAEDVRVISARLFQVVRQRLRLLRPPLLDHAGLNICLRETVASWQKQTGINCKILIDGDMDALGGDVSIGIFRIIQEALTNISRHAHANSAYIYLHRRVATSPEEKDIIDLEIRDNGIGMHEDKVSSGLGLVGMRERAWALGGSFGISSSPGNGMSITVRLPFQSDLKQGG